VREKGRGRIETGKKGRGRGKINDSHTLIEGEYLNLYSHTSTEGE